MVNCFAQNKLITLTLGGKVMVPWKSGWMLWLCLNVHYVGLGNTFYLFIFLSKSYDIVLTWQSHLIEAAMTVQHNTTEILYTDTVRIQKRIFGWVLSSVPGKQIMPSSSRRLMLLKLDSSVCGDCEVSGGADGSWTCGEGGFSVFGSWSLETSGPSVAEGVWLLLAWESACHWIQT